VKHCASQSSQRLLPESPCLKRKLRAHFKTHVRVSEADERGAALKETNVEHRPLHAHTTSVAPGLEMRPKLKRNNLCPLATNPRHECGQR
jgi:hypothetical protein